MKNVLVIVSRHSSTRELLSNLANMIAERIYGEGAKFDAILSLDHIDEEVIEDLGSRPDFKYVFAGNFPPEIQLKLMAAFRAPLVLVSMNLPKELRGKDLGIQELQKYMKLYVYYEIKGMQIFP